MFVPYIKQRLHRVLLGASAFAIALIAVWWGVDGSIAFYIYLLSYIIAGHFVIFKALQHIIRGQVFDEFSLMAIATLAAFFIEEYPEAITVMLLYELGEYFQHQSVHRARDRIRSMLDQRPEEARILKPTGAIVENAENVKLGDILILNRGERLSHDGVLISSSSAINTAKITGESEIRTFRSGDDVLSGFINEGAPLKVKVTKELKDSTLSRLFTLTQEAQAQKAPTELFFRKFAKVYTPAVALLAVLIFVIPYFFVDQYEYQVWLYRAAVFLVISCPCALVLSIPLTYFAGIGAASRSHILVKGAQFLDFMTQLQSIGFDKTGTLTKGEPSLSHMSENLSSEDPLMPILLTLSGVSHHPASRAINDYLKQKNIDSADEELSHILEEPGMGIEAQLSDHTYRLGRPEWVDKSYEATELPYTEVALSKDRAHILSIFLSDPIKPDARETLSKLKDQNIFRFLLSGDRKTVVEEVGSNLGLHEVFGELHPKDKLNYFDKLTADRHPAAFVGDGLNDSAVLAKAEVGIAMGNTGSDLSIESADVILPGSQLSKILDLIRISKYTRFILWQNIALVFAVKLAVLFLGALGYASLWAAILADVGVCLLAVANASRVLYKNQSSD